MANTVQSALQVKREVGDVSILVNNAGIVTGKKFIDAPDSLIEKTVEVNTMAHFWVSQKQHIEPESAFCVHSSFSFPCQCQRKKDNLVKTHITLWNCNPIGILSFTPQVQFFL